MKEKFRSINGSMCIGFALLFILIGAVQFILGHNRDMTAQTVIAFVTWAYAAFLLVIGILSEEKKRKDSSPEDFFADNGDDPAASEFSDDFDEPEEETVTIELAEERLRRFSAIADPTAEQAAEFASTLEGVKRLYAQSRSGIQTAEQQHRDAVDRAAEAYLNLDQKSDLLRKVVAKTSANNEQDIDLRRRAQRAYDKAKQLSAKADAQVATAERRLDKAKRLASRTGKIRRAYDKLSARFSGSENADNL